MNNITAHPFIPPISLETKEEQLFILKQFPILDMASGLKNMNADDRLFIGILRTLLKQEFPNERLAYQEAHAKTDWETIEKLAHKMKGGAIYIGLLRLQHACQHFETYYMSGQTRLLEALYQQIIHTLYETERQLETVIAKSQV